MKLIIHSKYGKFEGNEVPYDEKRYKELSNFLEQLHKFEVARFDTPNGELHMTNSMIDDCIIELIK
jgi:hypothetical protein